MKNAFRNGFKSSCNYIQNEVSIIKNVTDIQIGQVNRLYNTLIITEQQLIDTNEEIESVKDKIKDQNIKLKYLTEYKEYLHNKIDDLNIEFLKVFCTPEFMKNKFNL